MSNHTKGPWYVDPKRSLRVVAEGDITIASTGTNTSSREEWESNAKLIAAAPDMLSALKESRYTLIKRGLQESTTFIVVEMAIAKAEAE